MATNEYQSIADGSNADPYPQLQDPGTADDIHRDSWSAHKLIMHRLYIEERRPLKEVMVIMQKQHQFTAS